MDLVCPSHCLKLHQIHCGSPGGKVEEGETSLAAAHRELEVPDPLVYLDVR